MYLINDETAYREFKDYLLENPKIISVKGLVIQTEDCIVEVDEKYQDLLELVSPRKTGEFSVDGYKTDIVENQGYKFKVFI